MKQLIGLILVLLAAALMYPAIWLMGWGSRLSDTPRRPPLAPPKVEL